MQPESKQFRADRATSQIHQGSWFVLSCYSAILCLQLSSLGPRQLLDHQLLYLYSSQQERGGTILQSWRIFPGSHIYHFQVHPMVKNVVTWPHTAPKETGNCCLNSKCCLYSKIQGSVSKIKGKNRCWESASERLLLSGQSRKAS